MENRESNTIRLTGLDGKQGDFAIRWSRWKASISAETIKAIP